MSEPALAQKEENKELSVAKRNPVAVSEQGALVLNSFDDLYRMASMYVAEGMVPATFDHPAKVIVGWQKCADLRMPRSFIDCMYVVNKVPSLHSDGPLAVVMGSGGIKAITEVQFDDKGKEICHANSNMGAEAVSAVCRVTRSNGITVERSFTLAEAQKAQLLKNGTWDKYRRRMLQMRARSWALKDCFPDVLKGISIAEYDHNVVTNEQGQVVEELAPIKAPEMAALPASGAQALNEIFKPAPEAAPIEVGDWDDDDATT